jgi:uncharacterized protein YkwD
MQIGSAAGRLRWPVILAPIAALLITAVVTMKPVSTEAYTNSSASSTFDSVEAQVLTLINQYRVQNGAPAMTASVNLNRMAAWLAVDQANHNYMGHTDSLGRTFQVRIGQCDVQYGSAAENVAAGYTTAQAVFDGWRASPGHNANMLNSAFRQIGIGRAYNANSYYGWYWANDFSSVDDGTRATTSSTPPTPTAVVTPWPASMQVPRLGDKVSGPTFTFRWNNQAGADGYRLYVGRTKGSKDLYGISTGLATSWTARNIPTDGSKIYVRLWTLHDGKWYYKDYGYYTVVR